MSERRLSDAQVAFLRRCERAYEGRVPWAGLDFHGRRTARGLERRGLVSRDLHEHEGQRISSCSLTGAGRAELAATARDPEPQGKRIIPRGAETRATSGRRTAEAKRTAAMVRARLRAREWNEAYAAGTLVEYHPVIGEPESRRHRTRTEALVLPSGVAVIWLEGVSGCVALDAVRAVRA